MSPVLGFLIIGLPCLVIGFILGILAMMSLGQKKTTELLEIAAGGTLKEITNKAYQQGRKDTFRDIDLGLVKGYSGERNAGGDN